MFIIAWLKSLFGPKIMQSPGWKFSVQVDGEDLVVNNVPATCFGGISDSQDSGDTASGVSTRTASVLGCALPVEPNCTSTAGSPLPRIPWQTPVEITRGSVTITVPLIDNGPAKSTGNGIDLTIAAARRFDPRATANNFGVIVSYRIRGAAKYLNPIEQIDHKTIGSD